MTLHEAHVELAGLNRLSEIAMDIVLRVFAWRQPFGPTTILLLDAWSIVRLRDQRMELALDICAAYNVRA